MIKNGRLRLGNLMVHAVRTLTNLMFVCYILECTNTNRGDEREGSPAGAEEDD